MLDSAGQIETTNDGDRSATSADYADSLALGISMMLVLTIFQRGIGFLRNVLFCRFLEPSELGLWNLAFSAVILLAPFLVLGIPGVFGRYLEHFRQRGQLMIFLRRSLLLTSVLMILGVGTMLIAARYASWLVFGDFSQRQLTIVMILGLGFVIAFNAMMELCTALRQVRLLSCLQLANAILFAVIALLLIWVLEPSATSVMIGYAVACSVTCMAGVIPLWKVISRIDTDTHPIPQRRFWGKILPFAGSLWLIGLFSNLFAAADRYMIIHFCDASPSEAAGLVGQYHSSLIFPQLIVSVGIMLGSVVLPYLSHDWEQGNHAAVSQRINRTIRIFGVAATSAGAAVLLVAPWLFSWVLADKYALGLSVLPMTLVYCIWYGVFNIQQNYLFCLERAAQVGVAMMIGLAINISLNYVLLPLFGLQGAVIATSVANAGALAYGVFWAWRRGMTIEKTTVIVLLLPVCLMMGVVPAIAAILVFLWAGLKYHWILDAGELQWAIDKTNEIMQLPWRRKPPNVCQSG